MADAPMPPAAPTAEAPAWVKDPETGKVIAIHTPEDIAAAKVHNFVEATPEEADKAYREKVLSGPKGMAASAISGALNVVPFAHAVGRALAPNIVKDTEEADKLNPVTHAVGEVASIAAGAGVTGGLSALGEGAEALTMRALTKGVEAAGEETAASRAIPSLAERVLGRAANNATQGAGYAATELTNEHDLPTDPASMAEHVLATVGLGAVGGAIGGEAAHDIIKGASKLADVGSKLAGKASDALTDMAARLKTGDVNVRASKHVKVIQEALDHNDKMADSLVDLVTDAEQAGATKEEVAAFEQARIKAEDNWQAAKANANRAVAGPTNLPGKEAAVPRVKVGKILSALNASDAGKAQAVDALQAAVDSGKELAALHERLSQVTSDGTEGLEGKAVDHMQDLLETTNDIRESEAARAPGGSLGTGATGFVLGAVAHLHPVLASAAMAAKSAAEILAHMPPGYKASVLGKMAKVAGHVEDSMDAVAGAAIKSAAVSGQYAAPIAATWTAEKYAQEKAKVNEMAGNPQLAVNHLQDKYGKLNDVAPETFGQLAVAMGNQLELIQQALNGGPMLQGFLSPTYVPSATELAKMSQQVAVIRDPRVAEAAFARGTLTPEMAAAYAKAWPKRSQAFGVKVGQILSDDKHRDRVTMKTMGSLAATGLGLPRQSFSPQMIARTQGVYALKRSQGGGVGSRGGSSGASHISSAKSIQSYGDAVANRPVK